MENHVDPSRVSSHQSGEKGTCTFLDDITLTQLLVHHTGISLVYIKDYTLDEEWTRRSCDSESDAGLAVLSQQGRVEPPK